MAGELGAVDPRAWSARTIPVDVHGAEWKRVSGPISREWLWRFDGHDAEAIWSSLGDTARVNEAAALPKHPGGRDPADRGRCVLSVRPDVDPAHQGPRHRRRRRDPRPRRGAAARQLPAAHARTWRSARPGVGGDGFPASAATSCFRPSCRRSARAWPAARRDPVEQSAVLRGLTGPVAYFRLVAPVLPGPAAQKIPAIARVRPAVNSGAASSKSRFT